MINQGRKKIFKIEAFKQKVVMDPEYGDKTWKILEDAIREIYNKNASGLSFEELYRFFLMFPTFSCLILGSFVFMYYFLAVWFWLQLCNYLAWFWPYVVAIVIIFDQTYLEFKLVSELKKHILFCHSYGLLLCLFLLFAFVSWKR